jgi:hypothetical protein
MVGLTRCFPTSFGKFKIAPSARSGWVERMKIFERTCRSRQVPACTRCVRRVVRIDERTREYHMKVLFVIPAVEREKQWEDGTKALG